MTNERQPLDQCFWKCSFQISCTKIPRTCQKCICSLAVSQTYQVKNSGGEAQSSVFYNPGDCVTLLSFENHSSKTRCPNFCTLDILDWIAVVKGSFPHGILRGMEAFLETTCWISATCTPVVTTKNLSRHFQMNLEGENHP